MRRLRGTVRGVCIGLLFGTVVGCEDQLPTFADGGRFPAGVIPPTFEHVLTADEFLVDARSFTGPTTWDDVNYLIVAADFDGALDAHVLAAFEFPEVVDVDGVPNEIFEYADSSRVTAIIPDTLSVSGEIIAFELWTIGEPWDSLDVSWENAVDRPGETVAWTTPGGRRAELLGIATWFRLSDSESADSLVWDNIPAGPIARWAAGETHGLMVVARSSNTQALISGLSVEASIITESHPDTVVMRPLRSINQTFVYNPGPTIPDDVLRVGGITSDRTFMRMQVNPRLPTCALPGPGCGEVGLEDISLNLVQLVFDPVPVSGGYRPPGPIRLSLWRTTEPDLGERAPLAGVADIRLFPGSRFTPEGAQPLAFDVTSTINRARARGETDIGLVMLIEPEASSLSYGWLGLNPRLRFVYTIPPKPGLP